MGPCFALRMNTSASCRSSFRPKFKWKKKVFSAFILAQGRSDCVYSYLNPFQILLGWVCSTVLHKGQPRSVNQVYIACFLSHRGTWKEKCGAWQLTLSCPSVQQWAMIKPSGSGNCPPSTVCWQCESSKKVHGILPYRSIKVFTNNRASCVHWFAQVIIPERTCHMPPNLQGNGNSMFFATDVNSRRLVSSIISFVFPCIAQTFATWGQYVLLLLMESYGSLSKHISFPECSLPLRLTVSNNWFCYWKTEVSFI